MSKASKMYEKLLGNYKSSLEFKALFIGRKCAGKRALALSDLKPVCYLFSPERYVVLAAQSSEISEFLKSPR